MARHEEVTERESDVITDLERKSSPDKTDGGETESEEPDDDDEPLIRGPPRRPTPKAKARKGKPHPVKTIPVAADAYSIPQFCLRHDISVQLFYKNEDDMPDSFFVGKRRLISRESAARWRAKREKLANDNA